MPITGLNRIPGGGLAQGTLFDKTINATDLEISDMTVRASIILEVSGQNKYTITWTQPTSTDRNLTIPALGADNEFTFNDATQTCN